MQVGLVVVIPITVVAQIDVSSQVRVAATGVHEFILTPVEGTAPEVGLLVGNAVVGLLHETLEILEVHEGHLRIDV